MAIHKQLRDLLLESGLSEACVLLYIELLGNSCEKAWDLVGRTGLSKSSVYRAIEELKERQMISQDEEGLKALSLKTLIADLRNSQRKFGKLAHKIKEIAPFLHAGNDSVEEFEQFYTPEQIIDAYLFMGETPYHTNLDFGDFENFVGRVINMDTALKFREKRVKHAGHHAICTTFGPNSQYFCTKNAEQKFKNNVDLLKLDFQDKFVIFSDNSDYVLFNNFADEDSPHSTLVKSRSIADIQRAQFENFSHLTGK
jgi:hypothetical protein